MEFLIKQIQGRIESFKGSVNIERNLVSVVLMNADTKARHEELIIIYEARINELNFLLGFIQETRDRGL